LIVYAREQEDKEYIFRHYLMKFQHMDKKSYVPFEKYYKDNLQKPVKVDTRSMDEIMVEVMKIKVKE